MAQYELNLRDYIRIFRKRRTIIIVTVLLVTAGSLLFSRQKLPSYEAVTTIKIEERKTIAGLLTEWIVYNPADTMESQTKLIKGYPIMKKTALRLGLIDLDASEEEINSAISYVADKINTEMVGRTNIIRIIAVSSDPEEPILLANTVAEVFIEENLLEKTRQARSARQFITEQLLSLENRLKDKEERLKKVLAESKNVSLAVPIQEKLAELQFTLSDLLQKYTEKHPLVIQLREQISELQKQHENMSGEDLKYARLNREVEADKKLYSMLKERLEEARITEAQKVGDISLVNPAVGVQIISGGGKAFGFMVGGFLGIVLGFAFALIVEIMDTSIASIEDVEEIMKVPVLGIISSVVLEGKANVKKGLFLNLKRKFWYYDKSDKEERYVRLILHYNSTSQVAEAYRNVYTNLKLDGSKKTILITSAGPREGKTTILTNLGLTLAQSGLKVLLVSSDIRRPAIAKTFGVKREPGLTEVLLGMVPLNEAIRNVTDFMLGDMDFEDIGRTPGLDNLNILCCGQLPFNPAKILESKELVDLSEALKKQFDVIFFDSPPVLPVTDASILGSKLDSSIIVYEIGRTSREALLRAKNQLDSVGADITGIILNQTRPKADADVVYPYYYKYRYYREESKTSKRKNKLAKT